MATNRTKEIAAKAAMLPNDLQSEALQFVESLLARRSNGVTDNKRAFQSVKGILPGNYGPLVENLREMRRGD
jgi:hypothetical protein